MPKRALSKPPIVPRIPRVEEPPQFSPAPKVEDLKRPDRSDQKLEYRPKIDRSLRGHRGGEFQSPYMHKLRMDPSRLRREDTEQSDEIRELQKQKREIDDQINEIRNLDTRINPYNVNRHVEETVQSILADLRNMEQDPWSGNLDGFFSFSPLHNLFQDQFSISDEEEDNELLPND